MGKDRQTNKRRKTPYYLRRARSSADWESISDPKRASTPDESQQVPCMLADVRRGRLARFPYGLFFHTADDMIFVLARFRASLNQLVQQSRVG